jgi:CHAT domain-containing protein
MMSETKPMKESCLVDEDLYRYVSGQGDAETLGRMESHLTQCSSCRRNLAEVLEILQPQNEKAEEEISPPSRAELNQTIAIIKKVARKERAATRHSSVYFRWPLAAAASIAFVALTFWSLKSFYEIRKSEAYFSQAKEIMNQAFVDSSPNNLRLDLPFHSSATNRSVANHESLRQAENLFFQALAFREGMTDARLGLASIYLRESKLDRAREEFQKVLAVKKGDVQALIGRGVAQYEEAIQGADPLKRSAMLAGALADFDEALKIVPDSAAALYNKIWTLFESGLHQEALKEIERYLSRDSNSLWAEELKALKVKMRATQIGDVIKDVHRFARERNKDALIQLSRQALYQMPAAIMAAYRRSVELDQAPAMPDEPDSGDLRWAIDVIETVYRASTGDAGFRDLLAFHAGLSPPQRELKQILSKKFKSLHDLYYKKQFDDVLNGSSSLISQYAKLKDFWQVAYIRQMRGNSYYTGKADFNATEAEFRKMLETANDMNSVYYKAKALGGLALACNEQGKFDAGLRYASELKSLALAYNLKSMETFGRMKLGALFHNMGQFEQSFQEYAAALGMGYQLLNGLDIVSSLGNLAAVADRLGHVQDARSLYKWAIQQQDDFLANGTLKPTMELALRRLNLLHDQGKLALRYGDVVSAETFFRKSLESTPSGMHELEGRNRLGLAEIYLQTHRFPDAEKMVKEVIAINARSQYPELEWKARSLKGQLLEHAGHHDEAIASLQRSMETLESLRMNIPSGDLRQSFFADRFNPYKIMVSLIHASSNGDKKALEYVDRAKSMTLREYLHMSELTPTSYRNSINGGQKISDYPVVEYFFVDSGLLILFTRGEQIECISQKVSKEELSSQIHEWLESIKKNDSKHFAGIARRLYDELIAPVEKHIFADASEAVIFLPDGPLHLLPFAGLMDLQGHFLIEKTPIAVAPSRSVFRHCIAGIRKKPAGNLHATLIDGSAGLSCAQKELAYISRLYGRNAWILASKDQASFKQSAAQSEIVHFSGHATEMQGRPALLLRNSPNEILDCRTIAGWKMPQSYLVNLAGCSTGIGPLMEGESPWGLIPAFLNAEAPAIIASLAPVDDASTERLNCRFYELLQEGAGKARALQKAQIALLDSARSNSDIRPQSWIPYILIGNPQ